MNKELTTVPNKPLMSVDASAFELAQRQAKALSTSDLVPQNFRGNVSNCLIALEVSHRTGASPFMVMQNLYVIQGRPSWSSQYIISAINACGRFKPLRFKVEGEGDARTCIAWTTDNSGEVLESPPVSIKLAKDEGWFGKAGSKWKTMPEVMLRYRSAAFFGRLYAPDILMGMQTREEQIDMVDVTPRNEPIDMVDVTPRNEPIDVSDADDFEKAASGVSEHDHFADEGKPIDLHAQSFKPCDNCDGSGRIGDNGCPVCKGTGDVPE